MKQSEFIKLLKSKGAKFENAKKHIIVFLNGKRSHIPRHKTEELKPGLINGIKKQLGLK